MSGVLELPNLRLELPQDREPSGSEILQAILGLAEAALAQARGRVTHPLAALGRLRGLGRGASFGTLVHILERDRPIELAYPFEGSAKVGGAVWPPAPGPASGSPASALAKLRWEAGADDLPMHVHEHSDRFIIVHEGRGFFHVSSQPHGAFNGSDVRTVPARERDVFLFTRGVVHTFSTDQSPMTLLSCQLPHLSFDDPRQFTLPERRWVARGSSRVPQCAVGCDRAWNDLLSYAARS